MTPAVGAEGVKRPWWPIRWLMIHWRTITEHFEAPYCYECDAEATSPGNAKERGWVFFRERFAGPRWWRCKHCFYWGSWRNPK